MSENETKKTTAKNSGKSAVEEKKTASAKSGNTSAVKAPAKQDSAKKAESAKPAAKSAKNETKSAAEAKPVAKSEKKTVEKPAAKPVKAAETKTEAAAKPVKAKAEAEKKQDAKKASTEQKKSEPTKNVAPTKNAAPAKSSAQKNEEPKKAKTEEAKKAKTEKAEETKPTPKAKKAAAEEMATGVFAKKKADKPAETKAEKSVESKKTDKKASKEDKKPEKEVKPAKKERKAKIAADADTSKGSGKGGAVAISKKKLQKIIIISAAALLALILVLSLSLGLKSCNDGDSFVDPSVPFANAYSATTSVGFYGEYLGTVDRTVPEVKDGGLAESGAIPKYPTYGYTVGYTPEQKQAVISEAWTLCSVNTRVGSDGYPKNTFDSMDAEGNLYLRGEATGKKLYKHSASVGLYEGNVSDDEPRIVKRVTLKSRGYDSYSVTGLYAPAGEVIKIEISEEDMEGNRVGAFGNVNGILVHIGQALYNRKANNIWPARNVNRMPVILNSMLVTKENSTYDPERKVYTAYVGSFFGGPIYVHNTSKTTTVTISGGVRYSHFILGYTTQEEFAENAKSSAPYFDLEVWEYGVLHSGPNRYAKPFSYDDLYDAAIYWEKVSLVSTKVRTQGIVFLYDPFVAAGAAVAFPGQRAVNCPSGWMSGSLNYKSLVTSGSWGNMHEYNHNFQGWGLPGGGEVTNNAMTLVEYSLFTKISAARQIGNTGENMGGWNRYTSASWATNQICNSRENDLSIYSTLLHSFGQENFISCCNTGGVDSYFTRWGETVHYDMTYYASLIGYPMSETASNTMKAKNYPVYVPVASVYQTGRSYLKDGNKEYSETVQPYQIKYGSEFEIDLNKYTFENGYYMGGSVAIPKGFSYEVINVTNPEHGSIRKTGANTYVYTPDKDHIRSGKIIATLKITKDDGAFAVENVDLALEFQQSHEMNKTMLERTTYTFNDDTMYATAEEAFKADYAGYDSVVEGDNVNPVQNSNTDIWYAEVPAPNTIVEVKGKLYADDTAKYRLALRGRWNCALFVSLDEGKTYELAASFADQNTGTNFNVAPFKDYELTSGDWLYFKIVMVYERRGGTNSFFGLGWGKFVPPAPIVNENGEPVLDDNGYPLETPEKVSVAYASAYRNTYEFTNTKFTSDYLYTRPYTCNYTDNKLLSEGQKLIASVYSQYNQNHNKENICDGDKNTYVHTSGGVSEDSPLIFAFDLGEEKTANRIVIYSQSRSDLQITRAFTLYGSADGENYVVVHKEDNAPSSGATVTVDFEEATFRYYRLMITRSSGRFIIISEVELWNINEIRGGKMYSCDDEMLSYKGNWSIKATPSDFGHVYVGSHGASVEFEFEGNILGIISSKATSGKFEVYIDGKKVESIALKDYTEAFGASFISSDLGEGKHTVKIVCVDGEANIDAVAVFKTE